MCEEERRGKEKGRGGGRRGVAEMMPSEAERQRDESGYMKV